MSDRPISPDELSMRLRLMATHMTTLGEALSQHHEDTGQAVEMGRALQEDAAPMCLAMAEIIEYQNGAGHA